MTIQLIPYSILCLLMFACGSKNNSSKTSGNDSSKLTEKSAVNNDLKNELNAYIIAPRDTNYTGEYLDKYPNGNTKFKGYFRFGKRHGQWMAFYANGVLWSECYYDNGLKHGLSKVYYENSKPRYNGYFTNDKRDSLWVFYDEYGSVLKQVRFKNDEQVSSN